MVVSEWRRGATSESAHLKVAAPHVVVLPSTLRNEDRGSLPAGNGHGKAGEALASLRNLQRGEERRTTDEERRATDDASLGDTISQMGDVYGVRMQLSERPISDAVLTVTAGSSDAPHTEEMIGTSVVYKTRDKGNGGWRMAHVCSYRPVQTSEGGQTFSATFDVEYCSRGETEALLFRPRLQSREAFADKGTWWPLAEVDAEDKASGASGEGGASDTFSVSSR